jgi:hypothetical protein
MPCSYEVKLTQEVRREGFFLTQPRLRRSAKQLVWLPWPAPPSFPCSWGDWTMTEAALLGADIATVPYDVLMKATRHPLTDVGIERFMADWAEVSEK